MSDLMLALLAAASLDSVVIDSTRLTPPAPARPRPAGMRSQAPT